MGKKFGKSYIMKLYCVIKYYFNKSKWKAKQKCILLDQIGRGKARFFF